MSDTEKLQAAKDFLWKYIDDSNKKLILATVSEDLLKKNNLEIKCINLGYEYK
jgi:hypothetical protein